MDTIHFGRKIKDKCSNYINKDFYLSTKPEKMSGWLEKNYERQIKKAGYNYDLNMMYFKSLDYDKFDKYISKKIKKFKFIECKDLSEAENVCGIYILVLDKYKQIYIGQSENIKKRIISHWTKYKSLERLIFGDVVTSIISIDSFGPLDTTRIFYLETNNLYKQEAKIISKFDNRYLLNRTIGGIGSSYSYTNDAISAKFAVVANKKTRNYLDFVDKNKLEEVL